MECTKLRVVLITLLVRPSTYLVPVFAMNAKCALLQESLKLHRVLS